ncbi:3-deoxy-7-phosphoheptulonate synthase [Streptomyces sp. NPDC049879]|uniref:3-deoxy-7-phosphoheptulonate synthase n=1 Tax=Streptomyces sp. NPDC049879 TaxID=3365598 RepID=UPI0037B972CD
MTGRASALPVPGGRAGGTAVTEAVARLRTRPPLVSAESCHALQRELSTAAAGLAVVVQTGDPAEPLPGTGPGPARARVELLAAVADAVESAAGVPAVRIGYLTGRPPGPGSGPADVSAYYDRAAAALETLQLTDYLPVFDAADGLCLTYAGHRPLLPHHEHALVREDDRRGGRYGSSAHLFRIGEHDLAADGPLLAFAEAVTNPVAVEIGADTTAPGVAALITRLAEGHPPGRLSLLVGPGSRATDRLPRLLRELGEPAGRALWLSDPGRGGTRRDRPTRLVPDLVAEVRACASVLDDHGLPFGGLHLEAVPEPRAGDRALRLDPAQALAVARAAADRRPAPSALVEGR